MIGICCHGDWPHLPLGLCAGVCAGNSGPLPATSDWLLLVINYASLPVLTNNYLSHWHAPYLISITSVPSLQQNSPKLYTGVLAQQINNQVFCFSLCHSSIGDSKTAFCLFKSITPSELSNHHLSWCTEMSIRRLIRLIGVLCPLLKITFHLQYLITHTICGGLYQTTWPFSLNYLTVTQENL